MVMEPAWFAFDFDLCFFHAVLNFLNLRISSFTRKANTRQSTVPQATGSQAGLSSLCPQHHSGLHVYMVASAQIGLENSCVAGPFVNEGEG